MSTDTCAHCGGDKGVRNPTGNCDHLYWPDNLTDEARRANGIAAPELLTEDEWRTRDDLRKYWHAFCDADVIPIDRDDFTERLEKYDLVTWRSVTKQDVEDTPFAADLGIEMGGMIWVLTDKGDALLKAREG